MTIRVIHDRNICIGCGACAAVCSAYWEMSSDGKSTLKGAKKNSNVHNLELNEIGCNMDAAQSCPVNCIHVEDNGKKLI